MALRSTAVILALLLFAGEGVCSTLCAPEPSGGAAAQAPSPAPCHETAPNPETPPADHDCNGPCEAILSASGPELPSPAFQAAIGLLAGARASAGSPSPAQRAAAPERLPPAPARFLLHASFLI